MAILSRSDQQKIMIQYEREYGQLVTQYNATGYTNDTIDAASTLLREMTRFSKDSYYFDEDMVEILQQLSSSISEHFFSKQYAAA